MEFFAIFMGIEAVLDYVQGVLDEIHGNQCLAPMSINLREERRRQAFSSSVKCFVIADERIRVG